MSMRGKWGYKLWRLFKWVQIRFFPEFPESLCVVCESYVGTPCDSCGDYNQNFDLAQPYQEEMDRIYQETIE